MPHFHWPNLHVYGTVDELSHAKFIFILGDDFKTIADRQVS